MGGGDRGDGVEVDAGAGDPIRCWHAAAGDEPAQLHRLAHPAASVELEDPAATTVEEVLEGPLQRVPRQVPRRLVVGRAPQVAGPEVGAAVMPELQQVPIDQREPVRGLEYVEQCL